jgi:plastocyanin
MLTAFAGIMLFVAALITTGQRWTPLLGACLSVMVIAGNSGPVIYDLQHPESFHLFAFMVVAVALALTGTVAGIGATVQNYRTAARRTPRSMVPALFALAGVCAGAVLVAALPREAGAGVSPEVLANLPAITTPGFRFDRGELRVKAGETVALRFDNPHGSPHSFDIDKLKVHVPVAAGASGLVLFKPTEPGTYTYYCQLPGHREAGMEGTLVVEQ